MLALTSGLAFEPSKTSSSNVSRSQEFAGNPLAIHHNVEADGVLVFELVAWVDKPF
jgi:hypothetical protein